MNRQGSHQGHMGSLPMQAFQLPQIGNQFQQLNNDFLASQAPLPSSGFNKRYLVGNLSESFSFQIAPPSVKVSYIGLHGYSLCILEMGCSNKSKFTYDEQNNRLTILSLDPTTVEYYSAVDAIIL